MVKEAWGKKHTCPKCETRFYDLGKKGPAVCIECEHSWVPEPILKTKQSHAAPPKPVEVVAETPASDEAADGADAPDAAKGDADVAAVKGLEVEVEDDPDEKDNSVLGDVSLDDEKEDLSDVVDTKLATGGE